MAKQSGLGDNLYVDGYDVSGDTQSLDSINGGPAALEQTGIDKSAMERIGGMRDGGMSWTSFWDPGGAADDAHAVYSTLPTTDRGVAYLRGTTRGNPAAAMVAKQIGYDGTRGTDGEFTFGLEAQSNDYGLQWGVNLTAGKHSSSGAENLTSVDLTDVSTDFGAAAFLHVFSFTGTSCTVAIEDSADDAAFSAIGGLSFTAATGVTSERIQTTTLTENVRRYVRAVTTGTYTECTFAVVFVRNLTAVTY